MLVKFSVQNFLSFKELNSLEMVASNITQHEENTIPVLNYKLLKSAAFFGANASGKSNLFKAMNFAKNFILSSSKDTQANEKIPVIPFLLSTTTENEPSLFEFVFIKDNIKYRYGFSLNSSIVVDEWLFAASKVKESLLFERHEQKIKIGTKFKEGSKVVELTRKNALFLSVVAQFNGAISESILKWFYNLNIIEGFETYNPITVNYLENSIFKDYVKDCPHDTKILLALRLGYFNKRPFSSEEVAELLNIPVETVIRITKECLEQTKDKFYNSNNNEKELKKIIKS